MNAPTIPKPAAIKAQPIVPESLSAVALIDGPTAAAVGDICLSQWHELVRKGEAPQPAIRQPRYTRWRLIDVREYWAKRAEKAAANQSSGALMQIRAAKASAAAQAKRRAAATVRA